MPSIVDSLISFSIKRGLCCAYANKIMGVCFCQKIKNRTTSDKDFTVINVAIFFLGGGDSVVRAIA